MAKSMKSLTRTLQELPALSSCAPLGLGLSGGLDSMVLAEALYRAEIPYRALHFNHNWRGLESRADQDFVRAWCKHRKIPVTTRTWQAPTKTEAAARQARHRFFQSVCTKYHLKAIALAHHQDDLVETFLLQLLRGSGPEGLASLLPERTLDGLKLLRPLLKWSRAELHHMAASENISWREDTSNTDENFARNKLRRRILPYLKKNLPRDPTPLLSRTADILATENDYWDRQIPDSLPERLPVKSLKSKHPAYQRRMLRIWLRQKTGNSPSYEEIESVRKLLTHTNPAKVNLKRNRYCRRKSGLLFIEPP